MAVAAAAAWACAARKGQLPVPLTAPCNASSKHVYGAKAAELITRAREQVAKVINAHTDEITWTSGATESINLALKGAASAYKRKGKHIITWVTEHKATLNCCQYLAANGYTVSYLPVQANGLIDLNLLTDALRPETILISVAQVNNEIGVIQPIAAIGDIARKHGILLHVDAAQSFGKLSLDMRELPVDLLSISAHKIYGPKGIGALYHRTMPKIVVETQMHGGGQEFGLRSGTLATHQIIGLGVAAELAEKYREQDTQNSSELRDRLWHGIKDLPEVTLNGDLELRIAGNLNVCFAAVQGEALQFALRQLAVSSGAACTSASIDPSHVLLALGLDEPAALSSLRFALGRFTTAKEIDFTIELIQQQYRRLCELSPEVSNV